MNNLLNAAGLGHPEDEVDLSTVAVCRKIRNTAKLDRIVLDEDKHRNEQSSHLFEYLRFCGKEPKEFIKEYLSHLQPYMIERLKDQEYNKSIKCVLDNRYAISLYIKVDTTQFEEVIVSFHESHKKGIAKQNHILDIGRHDSVPVFEDTIGSHVIGTDNYSINIIAQRGLLSLPLSLSAKKYKDVFLVRKSDIENEFIRYCNDYLLNLYEYQLGVSIKKISLFSRLQEISFTSYNKDVFSTISLIIDNLYLQEDKASRMAADFALVTYTQQLFMEQSSKDELIKLLKEKFQISSHKYIDALIDRIDSNISVVNTSE